MSRLIGLVTPVMINFPGYCALLKSMTGTVIAPAIQDNWSYNHGVSVAWNNGIRHCFNDMGCTHVLITNDDIVICRDGANRLADRLDVHDDVIMTTGRQVKGQKGYDGTIGGLERMLPPSDYDAATGDTDNPDFSCFMIDRRAFDIIGMFDENFKPGYFEDNDYHYRLQVEGYRAANMASVPQYHIGSQTGSSKRLKEPAVTHQQFDANRTYYKNKWGGNPAEETFKTPFNDPERVTWDWKLSDRQGY